MADAAQTAAPVAEAPAQDTGDISQESQEQAGEQQASETQQTQKAIKKVEAQLKKKLKLKVDGKDIEEEFDPNDDEYMTKQLQMAKVAQKRMGEYAQLEREVREFIEKLRQDPKAVLSDPTIGIDMKKLAAAVIEEEIANSQKSPEQIEREKLENELKSLKDQREKERKDWEVKEFERLQEQEMERYDNQISSALESSDLPKSPYVVKKMADYLLMALNAGVDVTPEDVLPLVRDEIHGDIKDMFGVMPEEVIEKMIGKDVLGRIRKKKVASAKQAPPAPLKSAIKDTGTKGSKTSTAPKKTFKDFFGV